MPASTTVATTTTKVCIDRQSCIGTHKSACATAGINHIVRTFCPALCGLCEQNTTKAPGTSTAYTADTSTITASTSSTTTTTDEPPVDETTVEDPRSQPYKCSTNVAIVGKADIRWPTGDTFALGKTRHECAEHCSRIAVCAALVYQGDGGYEHEHHDSYCELWTVAGLRVAPTAHAGADVCIKTADFFSSTSASTSTSALASTIANPAATASPAPVTAGKLAATSTCAVGEYVDVGVCRECPFGSTSSHGVPSLSGGGNTDCYISLPAINANAGFNGTTTVIYATTTCADGPTQMCSEFDSDAEGDICKGALEFGGAPYFCDIQCNSIRVCSSGVAFSAIIGFEEEQAIDIVAAETYASDFWGKFPLDEITALEIPLELLTDGDSVANFSSDIRGFMKEFEGKDRLGVGGGALDCVTVYGKGAKSKHAHGKCRTRKKGKKGTKGDTGKKSNGSTKDSAKVYLNNNNAPKKEHAKSGKHQLHQNAGKLRVSLTGQRRLHVTVALIGSMVLVVAAAAFAGYKQLQSALPDGDAQMLLAAGDGGHPKAYGDRNFESSTVYTWAGDEAVGGDHDGLTYVLPL